jgi:hypothetical protein
MIRQEKRASACRDWRVARTLVVEEDAVGGLPHGRLHDVRRTNVALLAYTTRVARH